MTDTAYLLSTTKIIAVYGHNAAGFAGILASSSGGPFIIVQNYSWWKCSPVSYASWTSSSFDDSSWATAAKIGINGIEPWKFIPGIDANTSWFWSNNSANNTVYCRMDLSECSKLVHTNILERIVSIILIIPVGISLKYLLHAVFM